MRGSTFQQPQVASSRQAELNMLKSHKMPIALRMTAGPALSHMDPHTPSALCAIDVDEQAADECHQTLEEQIAALHPQQEEIGREWRWNGQQQNTPSASGHANDLPTDTSSKGHLERRGLSNGGSKAPFPQAFDQAGAAARDAHRLARSPDPRMS